MSGDFKAVKAVINAGESRIYISVDSSKLLPGWLSNVAESRGFRQEGSRDGLTTEAIAMLDLAFNECGADSAEVAANEMLILGVPSEKLDFLPVDLMAILDIGGFDVKIHYKVVVPETMMKE